MSDGNDPVIEGVDGEKPIVAVTGASRGIGHAIVKEFHAGGWEVFTLARTPFSEACPWADGASILRSCDQLRERLGSRGLNALINNAGISPKNPDGGRLAASQTSLEVMQTVQMVNVTAPLLLCNELLAPLTAAKGAVVNVTSIAGFKIHPFAGAAYAMSKAALSALTRELAWEFGTTGVRVNAVSPGEIETTILSPGTEDLVHREVPMDRLGSPEEVAEVVHFLCGSKASYVNGTEIHINGGQHV
jgi:NAD(P)-dependent dehydrogenase (short-subunit alcohol dehydrogenase family)